MNPTFDIMHQEADEIVYKIAFACQRQDEDSECIILECVEVVYLLVDFFVDKLKKVAKDVTFHLSTLHRSNFRYNVAVTEGPNGVGYKAGRGQKPYHYNTVRNYLIKQYGAIEIEGYEADDALGMARGENIILSHIDKDIDMIPGWHYNYHTDELYHVEEGLGTLELSRETKTPKLIGRGMYQFYAQLLTGDRTDNIPGIKGYGPVKVEKLLQGLKEVEILKCILKIYSETYPFWLDILREVSSLLWIVQEKGIIGDIVIRQKMTNYAGEL